MKTEYLLLTALLVSRLAIAQDLDDEKKVSAQINLTFNHLLKKGIDSILIYKDESIGLDRRIYEPIGASKIVVDSLICEAKVPAYIFWISKGNTYVQKIHPCFFFQAINISSSQIPNFLKENHNLLTSSNIKPFQFRDKRGRIFTLTVSHREVTAITAKLGSVQKK